MKRKGVTPHVVLPLACVPALLTRDRLVIVMTEKVPLQDALMRELQPAYPANVAAGAMCLFQV